MSRVPVNRFKAAIAEGRQQIGLWSTLSTAFAAEVVAGANFDWLLLDTEHSPGDVLTVLGQLQALSGYPLSPIVRPAANDAVLIKRYLDIGVQTLLIPYVQSADEARAAVAAVRYPPDGIRGVSALTRATRFGRVEGYAKGAAAEICLLVQVETQAGLDALEDIAAVEGVDGVFVGPGDLAASLGHIGDLGHPVVVGAVEDAIRRIVAAGKPAGVLTGDPMFARRCIELGTIFTAVGIDVGLLARAADALAARFRA
ncbi:MAG: 2,4-dihydroxyhept-2-ene,7-dioic acid aldolase [Sphingomonas bacterium]|uniref:aldolase/citrate lyase family protein n=1 Tax=Sphingomonas bacterium TaxID=1895847 RepID=UPI002604A732|nr:aldolase/citrate lyase family protein [Sphingomonas bacterium]MDB5704150.1 2,4-dihydroxyhept-2-ene,7-dioic acid aldolase [Sphingomonas bacterium]